MEVASTDHWEPKMQFLNFKISGVNKSVYQIWGCVWVAVVASCGNIGIRIFLKATG